MDMMCDSVTNSRIRVLSIDDHSLLRQGIAAIIDSQPDMALVASASSGRDGIAVIAQCDRISSSLTSGSRI